ncbi:MAG: integrating conjugative element protein [Gammaproteobacteria bacterium]|nr:integrating conjugative element protein [Gammaproteobacteria bacterium]
MQNVHAIVFCVSLLSVMSVSAEPFIIIDEGGVSTDTYRKIMEPATKVPDFGGQWVQAYSPLIQKDPENLSLWLPLTTDKLSPKRLRDNDEREVNYDLDAPICIIGSDDLSMHWIKSNLNNLVKLKARCWLVQADDFNDFTAISRQLQGKVLMMPADGDAIADFFGIRHYPVFIDQGYIAQ